MPKFRTELREMIHDITHGCTTVNEISLRSSDVFDRRNEIWVPLRHFIHSILPLFVDRAIPGVWFGSNSVEFWWQAREPSPALKNREYTITVYGKNRILYGLVDRTYQFGHGDSRSVIPSWRRDLSTDEQRVVLEQYENMFQHWLGWAYADLRIDREGDTNRSLIFGGET